MTSFTQNPRRAFVRANAALALCICLMTSAFMAIRAKEAVAVTTSPVCVNQIGSANCPSSTVSGGSLLANYSTCRSSAPFYNWADFGQSNPLYGCCNYDVKIFICYSPSTNFTSTQDVEYFRAQSAGEASCLGGRCLTMRQQQTERELDRNHELAG